jgi:hypothetical protein
MIDQFALALSHGLLAFAAWRLVLRVDLDRDPGDDDKTGLKPRPMAVLREKPDSHA